MKLKYAIIGTGALGGYYGAKLAQTAKDVHFLFHSDYQFVKENGLKIDSVNGNFHLQQVNAYNTTQQMPVCDVVFVCLKTNNNRLLKDLLPPLLHKNTLVVLVQNGLGIEQELASVFPHLSIAGGLAFICSSKIGDGHIGHFDLGSLTLGSFQGDNKEILKQIIADLNESGVSAEISENLKKSRWEKLVWNIPYNGMTVVLNTTTDSLMKHPSSRQLIREIMQEVVEAARCCGAEVKDEFAEKMMHSTDIMTPYAPSMKLDFDFKRPMEIDAIYTNPILTARKTGYEMKKVAMLEQQLRFIQSSYIK